MNTGILGGTFDPIHLGHLAVAEHARSKLNLEQVLFVPAGQPWLKSDRAITAARHRLEMVKRGIASNSLFQLSTVEIERPGPTYTVDTVAILKQKVGAAARLFLLLGWDSCAELPKWREPAKLIQLCQLATFPRPGFAPPDLKMLESFVPGISQHVVFLDMPPMDISSTQIRNRVAQGLSIHALVPAEVEKYILENGLYRQTPR